MGGGRFGPRARFLPGWEAIRPQTVELFGLSVTAYGAQVSLHSAIAALFVEALIRVWGLRRPLSQVRFRLLALLLPTVGPPLYQTFYPFRSSPAFRQEVALFDLQGWLSLSLWGNLTVGWALFPLLVLATALFIFQEAVPSLRRLAPEATDSHSLPEGQLAILPKMVAEVAGAMGCQPPPLRLIEGREPVSALGMLRPILIISPSLVAEFEEEELRAVIAHEMAHLRQRQGWLLWFLLLARLANFYNPVALIVFRRIVDDNEALCDDMAAAALGSARGLASSLLKVMALADGSAPVSERGGSRWQEVESWVHFSLLHRRLERMRHWSQDQGVPLEGLRWAAAALALTFVLFFVV